MKTISVFSGPAFPFSEKTIEPVFIGELIITDETAEKISAHCISTESTKFKATFAVDGITGKLKFVVLENYPGPALDANA